MPIYEYRCRDCGKTSTQFLRSISETKSHHCSHCGSANLVRLISRVTILKPFGEAIDRMPSFETLSDFDENDPKSVAKWMKRMRREMGSDFGSEPSDMSAMLDAGISPADLADDDSDL